MGAREINVTMEPEGVFAVPNPQTVEPGDTVTWHLGSGVNESFRVQVEGDDPFASLAHETDRIVGTIRQDVDAGTRFLYKFVRGGSDVQLEWGNKLEGTENFGGLDVPPPPPRG